MSGGPGVWPRERCGSQDRGWSGQWSELGALVGVVAEDAEEWPPRLGRRGTAWGRGLGGRLPSEEVLGFH